MAETPAQAEIRHADGSIEHPAVSRETADVRFGGVVATVLGMAVVFIVVTTAARSLLDRRMRRDVERFAAKAARPASDELPLRPRLEAFDPQYPAADSFAADARELEAQLHQYGRAPDAGFARVPIEVAIKHTAQKLQSKSGEDSKDEQAARVTVSGDANSGRVFRETTP